MLSYHRYWNGALDDRWTNGGAADHAIAQSLPIPIGPLGQHRQPFGLPQFQPKTSLSDRPGMLVPPLNGNGTSSSVRRASYAERDRVRPVDPGALAFDDDDDDDDEDDVDSDPETGGKARQRALKILQARNEMPAAGEPSDQCMPSPRPDIFLGVQACGEVWLEDHMSEPRRRRHDIYHSIVVIASTAPTVVCILALVVS